jgi:hypothetical protein
MDQQLDVELLELQNLIFNNYIIFE